MFEPGSQIGRYEIQRRLGRGGMGTVYVAHDPVLGRMLAIKIFAADLDLHDARTRFTREARAAAALNHPNIITIYDFGEFEGQPFIVMEYVAGETIAAIIRRKAAIPLADKVRWIEELCTGAGYAHQMHVVHRDIKPANVMVDRSGRLRILDFGIARTLDVASTTMMMIGTPGYMAPEQITGDPTDHRADQFAIGTLFYELLTYSEAFPGDSISAITHRILREEPAALERLVPGVPPEITAIVERTLKKSPADRFPDTESLRAAVGDVRRRFASSESWNAPALAVTPSAPSARGPGAGSARRQDIAVGVATLTPPPDPTRSTDRGELARRRATEVENALQQARAFLVAQQLDAALDACQRALTFDETHAGALDLEREISAALLVLDAARDGEPTRIAAGPPATAALPAPSPVLPPAERLSPIPAGAAPATVVTSPPAAQGERPLDIPARHRETARKRRTMVTAASVAAALLVAAIAGWMLFGGGTASTGSVIVNATPWGTVGAVQSDNGATPQLPSDLATPVSLTLQAGTYQITLVGPPPASQLQEITVRVRAGETTVAPVAKFQDITAEDYFEEYLSSPGAAADVRARGTPDPFAVPNPPAVKR